MRNLTTMEFLLSASLESLYDFELSRLNHAANLTKRLRATIEELTEEKAAALLARLLIETERLRNTQHARDDDQGNFRFGENAAD